MSGAYLGRAEFLALVILLGLWLGRGRLWAAVRPKPESNVSDLERARQRVQEAKTG